MYVRDGVDISPLIAAMITPPSVLTVTRRTYLRQKEKDSNYHVFHSSVSSKGKIITHLLLLALVCGRPIGQNEMVSR